MLNNLSVQANDLDRSPKKILFVISYFIWFSTSTHKTYLKPIRLLSFIFDVVFNQMPGEKFNLRQFQISKFKLIVTDSGKNQEITSIS